MATSLIEVATRAEDLFYQDYAPRDRFFDIGDFMFHAAVIYSSMLNEQFQVLRATNKRDEGWSNIENSSAWLIEEICEVQYGEEPKKYFIKTKRDIFSFNFDGTGNSLQGLCGVNDSKNRFRKISLNERRFYDVIPATSVVFYYLNNGNEIIFKGNIKKGEKIVLQYIPVVDGKDENCLLSDNIVGDVINKTLTLMFGAKNGNIIQESNDGNKNLQLPQQTNPSLNKVQAA